MMSNGDLEAVLQALKSFEEGYFVFTDDEGEQFVIMRQEAFERTTEVEETQLSLPAAPQKPAITVGDVLENINREIAMYQMHQEDVDETIGEEELHMHRHDLPGPRRIRFEPLKGDLPPDLQE